MASYSYTAGRRFVPCLGPVPSELLLFSDQKALFKRLANEESRARDRGNGRGSQKSHSLLGTVVRIVCALESQESTEIREPLFRQPQIEFSLPEAHSF